ncbi:Hsp20 family protein [Methanococcoides sp. SA1]|nr:Hsp20 family protein [Methanococcoides sp. SA1]
MNSGLSDMKVDVEGDEVVVRVEISGVEEKDIELEVKDDSLEISIVKDDSKSVEGEGFSSREWKSSSFGGIVALPVKVVRDKMRIKRKIKRIVKKVQV